MRRGLELYTSAFQWLNCSATGEGSLFLIGLLGYTVRYPHNVHIFSGWALSNGKSLRINQQSHSAH